MSDELRKLREASAKNLLNTLKKYNVSTEYAFILLIAAGHTIIDRHTVCERMKKDGMDITVSNAGVALHRLKERGLIRSDNDGGYSLTAVGKRFLKEMFD